MEKEVEDKVHTSVDEHANSMRDMQHDDGFENVSSTVKSIAEILQTFLLDYISTLANAPDAEEIEDDHDVEEIAGLREDTLTVTDKSLYSESDDYNDVFISETVAYITSNAEWESEKSEILLMVKACFICYSGNINKFEDANNDNTNATFQDFYMTNLRNVIEKHFSRVRQTVPDTSEKCIVKLQKLQKYLYKCFNAYGQDSLYVQVREQYRLMTAYNDRIEDLNTKHSDLDQKQNIITKQQAEIESKQKAIDDAIKNANESIAQQAQKVAESSITILGIFVGIVMVFFGDFSILSSAAAGLFDAPIYRLAIVLISFSAVLFNIIILLFYLISKLTQKSMGNACPYMTAQGCKDCSNCAHKPQLYELCRLRSTLPYVYWGNAVIVLLLIFTFCMYLFNGLYVELVPVTLRPFGILIQLSDTRSIQDMTFLQVLLSSVITVVAFVCLCKLGRPTQTKA